MSISPNSTLVNDGGGSSKTLPVEDSSNESKNESTNDEVELLSDNLVLDIPLYINEICYIISDYYSAGLQDLVDGAIQIKTVDGDSSSNDIWKEPIIKEAVSATNITDFPYYISTMDNQYKTNVVKNLEEYMSSYYERLESFANYSAEVEYMVALIQTELRNSLTEEEYAQFLNEIKDNTSFNSLEAFAENYTVGKYIGVAMKKVGKDFGKAAAGVGGVAAWTAFQKGGLDAVMSLDHGQILKGIFQKFVSGGVPASGSTPAFGSRLVSGIGVAAVFVAIGVGFDYLSGDFSWENVAVRAAKGGVAVASSLVGTAVTSALVGAEAGAWAGPIGMAVGALVNVVGNFLVDYIHNKIHYATNGIPKKYEDISVDDVKQIMIEEGYLTESPKFIVNDEESIYDAFITLKKYGANDTMLEFIEQKTYGNSLGVMDTEEYYKYNIIFRRFKYDALDMDYSKGFTERDFENFVYVYRTQRGYDLSEEEYAFAKNLFDLFSPENLENPYIQDLLDKIVNYDILDDWGYDDGLVGIY